MRLLQSGWVMLKNGVPQGMDQASGGYPYDATYISAVHIGTEERIKQWAHVCNRHGKKTDYTVAKVSLVLEVETND